MSYEKFELIFRETRIDKDHNYLYFEKKILKKSKVNILFVMKVDQEHTSNV